MMSNQGRVNLQAKLKTLNVRVVVTMQLPLVGVLNVQNLFATPAFR